MPVFKKIADRIRQSEDLSELKSISVRDILNGNILTRKFFRKQYPLIALMVFLSIFYIDNRYSSEKQITGITELKRKIQDAKYESLTISAELMEISRQSNILLLLQSKGMDLRPGATPPIVVE